MIRPFNEVMCEINELGTISGLNIDEYLELSNELLNNLNEINQSDISSYPLEISEMHAYRKNSEYIRNLNEYIKYKHHELSYTLQYQRNKKLKLQQQKSKSIYSNK